MKKNTIVSLVCSYFCSAGSLFADDNFSGALDRMKTFKGITAVAINAILENSDIIIFVNNIFITLLLYYIIKILVKWSRGQLEDFDLIYACLVIVITKTLLDNYNEVTMLCWSWSEAVAGGMQLAVFGTSDPFYCSAFLHDTLDGIAETSSSVNVFSKLALVFNALMAAVVVACLSVVAYIATMWSLYGYALTKMIGYFFVPFLMLEKTSFLFDGWLKLFFGFLIYGIIARANLILVSIGIRSYFALPAINVNYAVPYTLDITGQIMGFISFMCIAILALISTGRFAAQMGAGVGFGDAIQTLARSTTGFLTKKK